jgi:hypothetical protein
VLLASASAISGAAIALAVASLAVSAWQASFRWVEFRDKRKARIAVDPGEVVAVPDSWEVELWLTNVGRSHARRVRVWLEDEQGTPQCEEKRLARPVMSGDASVAVRLQVPRNGRSALTVRPVRRWREGRDVSLPKDVSEQRIHLA